MADINDVRAGEAAISQDTLNFKDWMMQRPNKNDNMDILKSLQSYAIYLEQKNPRISSLKKDEEFYALRKVMDGVGVSVADLKSILPEDRIPGDWEKSGEIARALNVAIREAWRNNTFADLKAGKIFDEGAMAAYMAKIVSVEKTAQKAPTQETTKVAASQTVDPKLKAFLTRTIGSDALAGTLTAKYGEKAYAVAFSAVMEPGNMVTDLGIEVDGKFSSRNLLATLAKDETKLDQAKLNSFLDNYSTRKAQAEKGRLDEAYGMKAPANEPVFSSPLEDMVVATPKKPDFALFEPEKPDLAQIKVTPKKSPAEQKYDELLAAKRKKTGDKDAFLTCGDLLDAGVSRDKDFQPALSLLSINSLECPKELYAAFPNRDAAVSKDVAVASLTMMHARKHDRKLYRQLRDEAKQPIDSRENARDQTYDALRAQERLHEAQERTNNYFSTPNEISAQFDEAYARRNKDNGKEPPSKAVDMTVVMQKGKERD